VTIDITESEGFPHTRERTVKSGSAPLCDLRVPLQGCFLRFRCPNEHVHNWPCVSGNVLASSESRKDNPGQGIWIFQFLIVCEVSNEKVC